MRLCIYLIKRLFWGSWACIALISAVAKATPNPIFDQPACFVHQSEKAQIAILLSIADNQDERRRGLQGLDELGSQNGMLFRYPSDRSPDFAFWMYKTRIPLDIAFLDDSGYVLQHFTMPACLDTSPEACPSYPAGVPFRTALELRSGFFNKHGLTKGAKLRLAPCENAPQALSYPAS